MSIIDKPSDYFNTITYSGNGSNPRTLTGVGFQPDWTWLKNRTDNNGHTLADSVRGANKTLGSDGSGAEITDKEDGHLDAFTSDGFTVGIVSDDGRVNNSGSNYVAWNWKAGGTASSNTDGSITSSVSANQDAGFSIVKWSGNGSASTIGHGLGSAPSCIITKSLGGTTSWGFYHQSIGNTKILFFNETGTGGTHIAYWNNTSPTSSVFTVGSDSAVNHSGNDMIAYCFSDVQGYSKFGSYIPNGGGSDNTFIYLGFSPAFIIAKGSTFGSAWTMVDNRRSTHNVVNSQLFANSSGAEDNSTSNLMCDFLSNGFKIRSNNGAMGSSGQTYIYMAFAENPFVTSNGVPATAR